jgi:hypothetical protein
MRFPSAIVHHVALNAAPRKGQAPSKPRGSSPDGTPTKLRVSYLSPSPGFSAFMQAGRVPWAIKCSSLEPLPRGVAPTP